MAESPVVPSRQTTATAASDSEPPGDEVLAGMRRRFGAYLLDTFLLFAIVILLVTLLESFGLSISRNPDGADPKVFDYNYPVALIDMVIGLIVSGLYHATMWINKGATPGQIACKILVCDAATGDYLTPDQAWKRWFALGAPLFPVVLLLPVIWLNDVAAGVAVLWAVVLLITTARQPMRRGLHDRFVGSLVIRLPKEPQADGRSGPDR